MRMGRRADGEGFRYSFSRLSAFPQNESPSDPCNIIVGGNVSNAHFLSQLCQSVIATPSQPDPHSSDDIHSTRVRARRGR